MTITPSLTQEQRAELEKFEKAEEYAAGSRISLLWMQSDPWGSIFPMCNHNAKILGTWINQYRDGVWTLENLDAAAEATHDQWLAEDPKEPVAEPPAPDPPKPPTPLELYGPWAQLTKELVLKMIDTHQYATALKRDSRFGARVDEMIKAGQITRADLAGRG